MRPLHFLQCLAWGALVVAVVSLASGGAIANGIHHTFLSAGATFAHAVNGGAR